MLSDELAAQLDCGREYWRQERQLCAEMLRAGEARMSADGSAGNRAEELAPPFSLEAVLETSMAKSFDYRVRRVLLGELA